MCARIRLILWQITCWQWFFALDEHNCTSDEPEQFQCGDFIEMNRNKHPGLLRSLPIPRNVTSAHCVWFIEAPRNYRLQMQGRVNKIRSQTLMIKLSFSLVNYFWKLYKSVGKFCYRPDRSWFADWTLRAFIIQSERRQCKFHEVDLDPEVQFILLSPLTYL